MSRRRNKLRDWFARQKPAVTKAQFAAEIGVTTSYVYQLMKDDPPWPKKEIVLRIAIFTDGYVSPNDMAGWPPSTPGI